MDFTPVTPKNSHQWRRFFEHQKYPLCAYSLDAIAVWSNDKYQPHAAEDGGGLVVCAKYEDSPEKDHMILPVNGNGGAAPARLRELADRTGMDRFWFVPQDYVEAHREELENLFDIEFQEGYGDYLYLTADLAELSGNKYHKKRNLIRQFTKRYEDKGRVLVEPVSAENAAECVEFLDRWCEARECEVQDDDDLLCERDACKNALENIEALSARGVCVRVDGTVQAFGVGSRVTDDMGALHFEKADTQIKGLYQFVDRECARRLFGGYMYTNKESDMGLPGLRKAKRSYHPVRMVDSYGLKAK